MVEQNEAGDYKFRLDWTTEQTHDFHREIRHLPQVQDYITEKAHELVGLTDFDEYQVVQGGGPQRYRAYVVAYRNKARIDEARNGTLTKAKIAMEGR